MPNLFDAIEFAARAHRDQYRKASRIPYIVHPLNVMRLLILCNVPEEVAMAGVLHDVVEDTPVTLDEVRAQFGDNVARLVEALSEPDRSDTWENRKRGTLEMLETAPQEVLLIELADKVDNLRGIQQDLEREGDAAWKKFNRGRVEQKWYHEELAKLFAGRMESECGKSLARDFQSRVRAAFGDLELYEVLDGS